MRFDDCTRTGILFFPNPVTANTIAAFICLSIQYTGQVFLALLMNLDAYTRNIIMYHIGRHYR